MLIDDNTARQILTWFNGVVPQGQDFIVSMSAIAFFFSSFEFYRQYIKYPMRKFVLPTCIFFLFAGIQQASKSFDDIIGVDLSILLILLTTIGMTFMALIFVFVRIETLRKEEKEKGQKGQKEEKKG